MEISVKEAITIGALLVQTGGIITWVQIKIKSNSDAIKELKNSNFQTETECIQIRKDFREEVGKDFASGRREFDEIKVQLNNIINILLEIKK
jgi:hypothetical protein